MSGTVDGEDGPLPARYPLFESGTIATSESRRHPLVPREPPIAPPRPPRPKTLRAYQCSLVLDEDAPGDLYTIHTISTNPDAISRPATARQSLSPLDVELPPPRTSVPSIGRQTRYMEMLLSLDRIPRLHNILAAFFNWILLIGLILLTATFTSPGMGNSRRDTTRVVPLLVIAVVATGAGTGGLICLAIRWRHNYVWLLNRIYLPGALNGLAGLVLTLTLVYSQHRGNFNSSASAVIAIETFFTLTCTILFVIYNNLLLARVRRRHQSGECSREPRRGFRGKADEAARRPSFAPGSIV